MNNVVLIGRLARDPELSYTPNTQTAVTKFTLAVDRPRKNGESQGADFIRITVYGRQAETCDRYLSKGRQAAVQGRIQTGSYKKTDGSTVYTTEVVADKVEFLGGGSSNPQGQTPTKTAPQPQAAEPEQQSFDELPGTEDRDFDQPLPGEEDWSFEDFQDIP